MKTHTPALAAARRRYAVAAAAVFVLELGVLAWRGPGRALIRGSAGDLLVIPLLAWGLGVIAPRTSPLHRAGAVAALALTLEGLQALRILPPDAPRVLVVLLGATFDPWDLVAYALGAVLAYTLDVRWLGVRAQAQTP